MRRTSPTTAAVAMCLWLVTSQVAANAAAAAPAPVDAISVRGTGVPREVAISWVAPAGYAGARVVVVPGTTATADPAAPNAVFSEDVPSPTSSITWSTGTAGASYAVSVFSEDASGSTFAAAATALVALPAPVTRLATHWDKISPTVDRSTFFVLPANADSAILCYRADRLPVSPADADKCAAPQPYIAELLPPGAYPGPRVNYVLFSFNTMSRIVGPPVSRGDGTLPPHNPGLATAPVDSSILDVALSWLSSDLHRVNTIGGATTFQLIWAAGTSSPIGNASAKQASLPTSCAVGGYEYYSLECHFRVTGLALDMPYAFVVRSLDVDGNAAPWSVPVVAAARVPGAYVVEGGQNVVRWRESRLPAMPKTTDAIQQAALAVEPNGTLHAGFEPNSGADPASYWVRAPGAGWRRIALPAGAGVLRLSASRAPSGGVALADRSCVYLRSRATWRKAGCLRTPEVEWIQSVDGLEIDRRGAAHVVYTAMVTVGRGTSHPRIVRELRYASSASGAWQQQRVTTVAEGATIQFTYDVATDKLVLVLGNPGGRYRIQAATKTAHDAAFGPLSTRYESVMSRAIVPTSVASYGDRITVAARRVNFVSQQPWGSPVLLTGTSAATVGSIAPVPGTPSGDSADAGQGDVGPLLFAESSSRVVVAWTHVGFSTNEQGIWTSMRSYAGGVASTSRPVRRTRSAYDALVGLGVDANGQTHIFSVRDRANWR